MKLAISKTVIISGGTPDSRWTAGGVDGSTLEATLMGKYLGVEIQVKGQNLIKHCESKMITVATNYAHTIMGQPGLGWIGLWLHTSCGSAVQSHLFGIVLMHR